MADKTLLNYKGSLDITDIPGALAGTKNHSISKISGRDYLNVHDIAGAIPKLNVGYTGNYRLDEQCLRGSFGSNQNPNRNNDLIGRPILKHTSQLGGLPDDSSSQQPWSQSNQGNGHAHLPPQNSKPMYHGNYNMQNGQQVDNNQLYKTFKVQANDENSSAARMERRDLFSQASLNDRIGGGQISGGSFTERGEEQTQKTQQRHHHVRYEDELDKFMTSGSSTHRQDKLDIPTLLNREKATLDSKLNQYKASVPTNHIHSSASNERSILAQPNALNLMGNQPISSGLLTSRNSAVAKSTANLILKPKQDEREDLFSNLGKSKNKYILQQQNQLQSTQIHQSTRETPQNEIAKVVEGGSPYQVQKKIKEMTSVLTDKAMIKDELGPRDNSLNYRTQGELNLNGSLKTKSQGLFKINASTIPDQDHFSVRQSQGAIKRSLNLAPSTQLGQHHKEEIDDSIKKREYTKLGGGQLGQIQMPKDLNNIQYHKQNPMKDYTYSALTGSYYYKEGI